LKNVFTILFAALALTAVGAAMSLTSTGLVFAQPGAPAR
jgi:hypothetical protein